MKASVVITTYNDDKRLALTLWGWVGQSDKDFEITIINDGGDNAEATKELVLSYTKFHKQINYGYLGPSKKDLGGQVFRLSAARNAGIRVSMGKTLIISDCDTVPHPDLIKIMTDKARDDRVLIGVRKRIAIHHAEALTKHHLINLENLVYSNDERLKWDWFPLLKDQAPANSWAACWGCLFAAPLHKVKLLGGFDEQFKSWGGEDEDMAERLVRGAGCKFYTIPEAFVYHLDHPPRDPAPYTATKTLERIRQNWTPVRNGGPM